jgi:5-methylcytosine-specific restriction endonuclease McrA
MAVQTITLRLPELLYRHIISRASGGPTVQDNLWLACPPCNGHKATQTHGTDSVSGEQTPLFNPRKQTWREHFAWSQDGTAGLV